MHNSDLGGTRKWWTLATVCTGVFMLLLDLTVVNVALPNIEHAFHASLSDLQWVVSAYALALAAFLLTAGSLADLYGRRLLFANGIVLFTAGSLFCGLANSSLFLMIARGAQGVGGAIMFATALALLAQAFQGRDRGIALGFFGAVTGIAVAIGPVLGGVLTTDLSWRWIFFVNVPIGAIALAMTLLRVDESRNPQAQRPDWIGFVTFSAALAGLVFGLIESQSDGWSSATVIGSLAASAALLVFFLVAELAQREPMLDLALLRVPTFGGGLIAALVLDGALYSQVTYLVIYLQNSLGYSAVATGIRFLPFTCAIFVAAGVAGRLTTRLPRRGLMGVGFMLVGGGSVADARADGEPGWTHLLAGMIVSGIGGGLVGTPLDLDRSRRRRARPGWHGLRDQHDPASGRRRDWRRRLRHDPHLAHRSSIVGRLSDTPRLAPHAHAIAHAIATGGSSAGDRHGAAAASRRGRRKATGALWRPEHGPPRRRSHRLRGRCDEPSADPRARLRRGRPCRG